MVTAKTVWLKDFLNEGAPGPEHFEIVESEVNPDELEDGGVVVEIKYMSVDPYLRGQIKANGAEGNGRRVMNGFVSGVVVDSKTDQWKEGDFFGANLPFSTFQVLPADTAKKMWKLTGLIEESQLSYGVGVLGMPGSTAYAGVAGILRPEKEGETMFVSAASGAVGSLVGQIAKNVYKLKTVGSCGGADKGDLITSKFGYDEAIDYKSLSTKEDFVKALKEKAPDGIDMYFENVGGVHFDATMDCLNPGGRVAVCGLISGYNEAEIPSNAVNLGKMIYTGQRIEGFVCFAWLTGQKGHFFKDMAQWIKDGQITGIEETFYEGIENWPTAFQSLFVSGSKNKGKVVVRI